MSLQAHRLPEVPEDTARIARAAFRKGNVYMRLRDALGGLYADEDFTALFPAVGQPAESPWRLALVMVMQFLENLSDRQAADAVRGRIDWKYALCLELSDPGFDFSILSEFRSRLVAGGAEQTILERMLTHFQAQGLVKAGGRQRTDATHVLAAIHALNRLELVGRTLQAVLEGLAVREPEWLKAHIDAIWFDRYSRQFDEYRLPKKDSERQALAEQVGRDGQFLLDQLARTDAPQAGRDLAALQVMRQVWTQQYEVVDSQLRWRNKDDLPPSGERIVSPHETQARYSLKRDTSWVGYKVHVTESCDDTLPHLITQVETTAATTADILALTPIQQGLAQQGLLPAEQVVDMGYGSGESIHDARSTYGVDLICPVHTDTSWQARTPGAFDQSWFTVDWEQQFVTCPQGQRSSRWITDKLDHDTPAVYVRFSPTVCQPCPARARCTHSRTGGREVTLIPREAYEALHWARQRQQTDAFQTTYHNRAGIEGTLSQAVAVCGLRRTRYRGLAKTHLQHVLTAAALNVARVVAWLNQTPRAKTRSSHFAALAA